MCLPALFVLMVRIIISELFLEEAKKTIQPLGKSGFAGGAKYRCQGILYVANNKSVLSDSSGSNLHWTLN